MKTLFLILTLIHGLIHLLGFLKSFSLAELYDLILDIPPKMGFLWLFSAFLFLSVFVLFAANKDWWWIPAILATIISQILIILTWKDTKFGTIPNTIVVIAIIIGVAMWNFNRQVSKEINLILSEGNASGKVIITWQMLESLPPQVQLWLTTSGVVGKENIQSVYFKQKGVMKLKPDQKKWSDAEAEQYITTDKPAFIWKVDMGVVPLVNTSGRDLFVDGNGHMLIKIASLVPVVDITHNAKLNQSTLQRYLLEIPWYPTAALSSYITWESIDRYSAKATMTYKGVSGSAIYHFTEYGDLEKVSALRYKDTDDNAKLIECIGEVRGSTIVDGIKIPTKLHVSWVLEEGKFVWYKLELFDIEFNIGAPEGAPEGQSPRFNSFS
ncbi:DUF6920 family protein [Bacillus sp. 2205SS5-2]|uniref:DUF6920 family protein n=1 Tax=Bacillus sp. 2205SS5-2 TaxID=3109031 RepID=UPI003007F0AB